MAIELHKNIVVEPVGDDLLVCDLKGSTVAMLSGSHADVVRAVSAGDEVPASLTYLLDELITRGVLRDTSASSLFSRRKALGLAAGAAGVGFLTLAMPQVAVAASGCAFVPTIFCAEDLDGGLIEVEVGVEVDDNPCGFIHFQLSDTLDFTPGVGTKDSVAYENENLSITGTFPVFLRGVLPGGTSFSPPVPVPAAIDD